MLLERARVLLEDPSQGAFELGVELSLRVVGLVVCGASLGFDAQGDEGFRELAAARPGRRRVADIPELRKCQSP